MATLWYALTSDVNENIVLRIVPNVFSITPGAGLVSDCFVAFGFSDVGEYRGSSLALHTSSLFADFLFDSVTTAAAGINILDKI